MLYLNHLPAAAMTTKQPQHYGDNKAVPMLWKTAAQMMLGAAAEVGDRAGTADCGKGRGKIVINSTSHSLFKLPVRWSQIILVCKHCDRQALRLCLTTSKIIHTTLITFSESRCMSWANKTFGRVISRKEVSLIFTPLNPFNVLYNWKHYPVR